MESMYEASGNAVCFLCRTENAVCCCACGFPLHDFCLQHTEGHKVKGRDFHFTLPLSADRTIQSLPDYHCLKPWLIKLKSRDDLLRAKEEMLTNYTEHIEEVSQSLSPDAGNLLKTAFSVARDGLHDMIERGINESHEHAFSNYEYVSGDSRSPLLWNYQPQAIDSLQPPTFQITTKRESLNSVFQVAVVFSLQRNQTEHFDASRMKAQFDTFKNDLHSKGFINLASEDWFEHIETQYQEQIKDLKARLQVCESQIRTQNQHYSLQIKIQKENISALTMALYKAEATVQEQIRELKEKEQLNGELDQIINAGDKHCTTLTTEIQAKNNELSELKLSLNQAKKNYWAMFISLIIILSALFLPELLSNLNPRKKLIVT